MTDECSVCMMPFEDGESKVTLGCSHTFHYGCILKWNLTSRGDNHKSCPLCRENMGVDDTLRDAVAPVVQPIIRGGSTIDHMLDPANGLSVKCRECGSDLYMCDSCGISVCLCQFTTHSPELQFHCPMNPFEEPISQEDLEVGEIPMIHCSRCFMNREDTVLEFMMDDHGDGDIFYHDHMQELYEIYFEDNSGRNNSELYTQYPTYTFDEFRERMEQLFRDELSASFESDNEIIDLVADYDYEENDFEIDVQPAPAPQEPVPAPRELVPAPQEPVPALRELVSAPQEPVPALRELVSANREHTHQEDIAIPPPPSLIHLNLDELQEFIDETNERLPIHSSVILNSEIGYRGDERIQEGHGGDEQIIINNNSGNVDFENDFISLINYININDRMPIIQNIDTNIVSNIIEQSNIDSTQR